jgi:hypothetical protein
MKTASNDHHVSARVGNIKNNDPSLIEPVELPV